MDKSATNEMSTGFSFAWVYDNLQPFLFSEGIGTSLAYPYFMAFHTSKFIIPCSTFDII